MMAKRGEKQKKKLWARGLVQLVLVDLSTGKPIEAINNKPVTAPTTTRP